MLLSQFATGRSRSSCAGGCRGVSHCRIAAVGVGGGEEGGSRSRLVKSNVRNLLQERSIRESKKGLASQEQRIGGMVVGNFN